MKDILSIVSRNILQPIVISILLLASILLLLGDLQDAYFISVVIVLNTAFGIIQEIRARNALKKLELLSAPRARILQKDGSYKEVLFDELSVGDQIKIATGDEIPADATIEKNFGLEINESMLTGESASVVKGVGDEIFAASTAVAGSALARVSAVGSETKAGKMGAKLKHYKPTLTPLQKNIVRAITLLTYGALGIAVVIGVTYYFMGKDAVQIFKTITSAAVTIVPEGLLLASSVLLAFGSLKLAAAKVLPQKLSAIEAMALLNILCVDKTGTLTSADITFEGYTIFDKTTPALFEQLVAIVATETDGGSSTGEALAHAFAVPEAYKTTEILAFSSERKMSGTRLLLAKKSYSILIGAPEFIAKLAEVSADQQQEIDAATANGERVLLVARAKNSKHELRTLDTSSCTPIGIIRLSNPLREGVRDTVDYLQKNKVSIRVISGDNPKTVQFIAKRAGIKNPDRAITGAELAEIPSSQWDKTVLNHTIFARVLPEQKEKLIATFQKHGNFTGMVGDGVNDALALKKADLGVAMYAGATASRRVADIVLLNNSFTSLPLGMKLGNKIMQAIEIIATLFFHKIIYGLVLLGTTLLLAIVYPYAPRHITFMNIFMVTLPTIMWTLWPPLAKHRINPSRFWKHTLFSVAPIALISGFAVAFSYVYLLHLYPHHEQSAITSTVIIATLFGVFLVFLVGKMLGVVNDRYAKIARLTYVAAALLVTIGAFGFNISREFFNFTSPAWINAWPILFVLIVSMCLQWQLAKNAGERILKD